MWWEMKFGQENKFFLGSSHHGVFSSSLIFSFGYTQPYPSLRSLVNPFILYPCTTSFILPSFILATNHPSIHHSFLSLIIHSSILHPCNSSFIHPSSLQLILYPSILHLCSSSFIHASYFLLTSSPHLLLHPYILYSPILLFIHQNFIHTPHSSFILAIGHSFSSNFFSALSSDLIL